MEHSSVNYTGNCTIEPERNICYIFYIVVAILSAVTLTLNILVIYVFCSLKTKKKKIIPNIVLLFQSLNDFLIGLYLSVYTTTMSYWTRTNPLEYQGITYHLDRTTYFLYLQTFTLSVSVLLIGSFERFAAFVFPFQHRR